MKDGLTLQATAQRRIAAAAILVLLSLNTGIAVASQTQNRLIGAASQLTLAPSTNLVIPALGVSTQPAFRPSVSPKSSAVNAVASFFVPANVLPGSGGHSAAKKASKKLPAKPYPAKQTVAHPAQAGGDKHNAQKTESITPKQLKQRQSLHAVGHIRQSGAASGPDADSEVINNILGAPVVPPTAPPPTTVPTGTPAITPVNAPRQNASPDNAGSATVAQPSLVSNFDYGVYTFNSRMLEDYAQHVQDSLELAREMALSVPKQQIDGLLKTAAIQRRVFSAQYPSPKPEESLAGLLAFEEARKALLDALALASVSPRVEGRAIWLDRASIVQAGNAEGLKTLLLRLHHAGINIVYFETFNAGFPIYPSKLIKSNPLIQNWDPLAVAVTEGHRLGMEVHAWVWAFAVGNRRHNGLIGMPESYPGPILSDPALSGEALRNKRSGLAVDTRQHEFWLSPASPKARAFLLSLYSEIVSTYAVDGLHLDYIRYPFQTSATRMGYEAVGREAYYKATGKSVDDATPDAMRLWAAWKTVQISNFVRDVSTTLRPLRPGLKISAAVFPMRRAARLTAIQQDWETWVDHGWVDTLSPMSYTTDPARLQAMYEAVSHSPKRHTLIYPGVAINRLDNGQLLLELEALREKGSLGSTLFAAVHLTPEKADALSLGAFRRSGDSLPPHHDPLRALSAVLEDYQEALTRVSRNPVPMLPESLPALHQALYQFKLALDALKAAQVNVKKQEAVSSAAPPSLPLGKMPRSALQITDKITREKTVSETGLPEKPGDMSTSLNSKGMLAVPSGSSAEPGVVGLTVPVTASVDAGLWPVFLEAQQSLDLLSQETENWLSVDRTKNPLRARYFEKNLQQLGELLAYYTDRQQLELTEQKSPADFERMMPPIPSAAVTSLTVTP
jgi:uncharacterized lipoprotein YddW (UPF0748 family)